MTAGGCSSCTGQRVDGILRHRPECPSYRPAEFCFEHPDVVELDAFTGYWYPDEKRTA